MRVFGLERSGTNYPVMRLRTPEELTPQSLITSCRLMGAKVSCFVGQQLTDNPSTHSWQCASLVCRACLHCSQPRSSWVQDIIFWLVFRSSHVAVNYQFFQASDVIVDSVLNPLLLLPPFPFPADQRYNAVLLGKEEVVTEYSEI